MLSTKVIEGYSLLMPISPRQPSKQQKKDLNLNLSIDASTRVWRIFMSILVLGGLGGGSFTISKIYTKLDAVQAEVQTLHDKDVKKTELLKSLMNDLDNTSSTAKEPTKGKLSTMSKRIRDFLDEEKRDDNVRASGNMPKSPNREN